MYLTSRPEEDEDQDFLGALDFEELQLVAALLGQVKLGMVGNYRLAALSLIDKIEDYVGDEHFISEAGQAVQPIVLTMDAHGNPTDMCKDFEIIV